MRVALVHDYLTQYGGAERVLEALHGYYPDATVVTAIVDRNALPASFSAMRIVDAGLQRIPVAGRSHRIFLPVYPAVFRRLGRHVADADVVIADSSAWAHHIGVRDGQALICYCHSPARFLYGDPDYVEPAKLPAAAAYALGPLMKSLRGQDKRAAERVDRYIANSGHVAERIRVAYGRDARVVYPPVDLARFRDLGTAPPEPWFLVVSRLVPHKRVDLAIEASARAGVPLKIIGTGRSRASLEAMAGPNVEFLGQVSDDVLVEHLKRCRALILPATEDFGMTSIEAQAAGRPVIALGKGGALESIREGETGLFFREPAAESLTATIRAFGEREWSAALCRANAQRFDKSLFLAAIEEEAALALRHRGRLNLT